MALYKGIIEYVTKLKERFEYYLEQGHGISGNFAFSEDNKRQRRPVFKDGPAEEFFDTTLSFKINTYYVVIDRLCNELQKRLEKYTFLDGLFGFLLNLQNLNDDVIRENANQLKAVYKDDLSDEFPEDCISFKSFIETIGDKPNLKSAGDIFKYIHDNDLITTFPNVFLALKIFLVIPVTNASGEKSFSSLKLIKTYLRNSLSDDHLTDMALLSIEGKLLNDEDTDGIISAFLNRQGRKWRTN